MAIRRAKRKSRFSQIPNETLQDARLTFEARGVLGLLLSKPEDWIIHKSWILTQSPKCGRDKMNRIFKELQYFGYLEKDFDRSNNGQFNGVDWLLHDTPYLKVEQPQSEKPQPEKPDSGKSASTNTDLTNTDNTNIGDNRGGFSQQVKKSTNSLDPDVLTVWSHIRKHVDNTYSGYELPKEPNDRDIASIIWAMGVLDDLTDEGMCLSFCRFILYEFGDAEKIYNPLCRVMYAEQIPEQAWSDLFYKWYEDC